MKTLFFLMILLFSTVSWSKAMDQEQTKLRIQKVYNELNINNLKILDDFYAESVEFNDPIVSIKGLKDLRDYYAKMYKDVKAISFTFQDFIIQDHTVVATWVMTYSVDALNGGDPIMVPGNSLLKFDDSEKVVYHRDYFDAGAMVYEHVPVVGFFIRKIKHSMQEKSH